MSRDRRGFSYALEPVRSMTAWEIDQLGRDLADANAAVARQQAELDQLGAELAAARTRVIAQRQAQSVLDIDAQRNAHGYMLQVQRLLQAAQVKLGELLAARDDTLDKLVQARKFADSLDRNKDAAAAEHDQRVASKAYQEADDSWLQRQHGGHRA